LRKYNRHWERGFSYPYPKKRFLFAELVKNLDTRFIVQIVGLRRTGKTVLMFQLINYLKILYFTFDEEIINISELLDEFRLVSNFGEEKIYVFLDEIRKLKGFETQIKVIYDLYPNIKFFISGSASLFIRKYSRESLAGRVISFYLPPLNFKEYLYFVEKDYILENLKAYYTDIRNEFEKFMRSQLIETINLDPDLRKEYYKSIVKKITYEDIPSLFPVDYPDLLYKIVKIICDRPGMLVDYTGLANDLGVSNKTISTYLNYLTDSFLLRKIYNFSGNLLTSEKKLKKFYPISPSFSWALGENISHGSLVENTVLSVNNFKYFWRDAYKREVDFVYVDGKPLPIEVKYKEQIDKRDLKGIIAFSKKFKVKSAKVLAITTESVEVESNDLKIDIEPLYLWV